MMRDWYRRLGVPPAGAARTALLAAALLLGTVEGKAELWLLILSCKRAAEEPTLVKFRQPLLLLRLGD